MLESKGVLTCPDMVAKSACAEESCNEMLETHFLSLLEKPIGERLHLNQNLWHIGIPLALHENLAMKIECIIWKQQNKEIMTKNFSFSIHLMRALLLF